VAQAAEVAVSREIPARARSFRLLLVATAGGFTSYSLLLPVVPLWAVANGASPVGAGATTAVFMLVTVLTQLGMPWLLRRLDHRWTLAGGILLVTGPTPLFAVSTRMWALLAVSGLRGVGFGLLTVSGSALVAELVPASRRGRATGVYGLAVGMPNVVFLATGVWLSQRVGFVPLFWLACVLPTATAAVVLAMVPVTARAGTDRSAAHAIGGSLLMPWIVVTATSLAAGGLVAFLPLAIPVSLAAPALLLYAAAMLIGRWMAGPWADRMGAARGVLPSVLLAGMGMATAAIASAASPPLALLGAFTVGIGFGALQNFSLVLMFQRAASRSASTVWNIALDAGTGLGSLGFGLLIDAGGYAPTFVIAAGLLLACTLVVAVRGA
jgi:predicted MFS family arabinose efflux permease